MATAVTFGALQIPGVVLEGVVIEPRELQARETKFWGVNGVSRIHGGWAGRRIIVPIIIYDSAQATFQTAATFAAYLDALNTTHAGTNHDLTIHSASNYPEFADCVFEGFQLDGRDAIKHDDAGTVGGFYFAIGLILFRQLSTALVDP